MLPLRFLLWCCLFVSLARAQEPACLHYTIDEGLPSNEVYDTYEDHAGYIWFASDHGISRFDGYSFRNYSTSDGLVHNTIFGFHEDSRGRLWMRAFNSSLCYLENDTIRSYAHNKQLQTFLGRDFIQCFAFDKAGNLFFVPIKNKLGLYRQDAASGTIERIKLPHGFNAFIRELDSGEFIEGIDLDNGYVSEKADDDSLFYEDNTWLFRMPYFKTTSRALVRCERKGKSSYVFTYDAALALIENGKLSYRVTLPQLVNKCYFDPGGKLWLCTDGFMQLNRGQQQGPAILKGYPGTAMLCDRMGNYWFTTIDGGIFLIRNMQVATLNHLGDQQPGELISLNVYRNNLFALNNKGAVFNFRIAKNGIDTLASETWSEKIPNTNVIYSSTEKGRLFLRKYIYQPNGPDVHWNTCTAINGEINYSGTRDYAQSGDSILVAANNGWFISDVNGKRIYDSYTSSGFTSFCTSIAVGPDHKIWIGTSDGLYTFSKNKTIPFEADNELFRQRVTDIAFGKAGEVFVSTRGGGLIIIDGDKKYVLRMSNGLSSDQCGNICVDDSVLWLCSNNGLNRIALSRNAAGLSFRIRNINTQHGLPSGMVSDAVRAGNFIFLATGKGLAWLDVNTFCFNFAPPPVYINSFLSNNEINTAADHLTYKDRNISIGFIGLLFRSPGVVNYRYKLEGYEAAWNYTTERMARYFNLPPGQYTFIVSAMNENGVWNEHPAMIRFYIPAHFSETTWFRSLLILFLLGISAGVVFYYIRQQRDRARTLLALTQAEQKALHAQMKPHFIFNSLNSIQNFIINRDDDSAHIYLTSFAQLMRRVLDHSRSGTITLQEEIETMGIYLELEKLRFGELFIFSIDVQAGIQPSTLLLPPLFIQPYVENAIWHGLQLQKNAPHLDIRFSIEKNKLVCSIEDNGIGRKRSAELKSTKKHTSTGMKNAEERIALLNSTTHEKISVEIVDRINDAGEAAGTRVILFFPVNRKDEN
jgi:hypothetical protein